MTKQEFVIFEVLFLLILKNLILFQAKKQYEKSFKESEKAQENYKKADADIHLSRAEVEKVRICSGWKQWFDIFPKK